MYKAIILMTVLASTPMLAGLYAMLQMFPH